MNIYEASKKLGKSVQSISNKLRRAGIKPIGRIVHTWMIERTVNNYDDKIILNLWNKSTNSAKKKVSK